MEISVGKTVIYRSAEICRVTALERKMLDGKTTREYWVLSPIGSERATYYVPADCAQDKLREPLTREEVLAIIDSLSNGSAQNFDGKTDREKKAAQEAILSHGSHTQVLNLTRTLYCEQEKRRENGKKLAAADERAMKAAESLINREFGFVLGIEESEVPEFIRARLAAE